MQVSILQMLAVSRLMNQAVGDALSGLLLCCAVLRSDVSLSDWEVRCLLEISQKNMPKLAVADLWALSRCDGRKSDCNVQHCVASSPVVYVCLPGNVCVYGLLSVLLAAIQALHHGHV